MKWYQKKSFYIPLSLIMGVLGFGGWFASLLGVRSDDELNKDYFTKKMNLYLRKSDRLYKMLKDR